MKYSRVKVRNKRLELISVGVFLGFVCGMPIGLGFFAGISEHIQTFIVYTVSILFSLSVLIFLIYLFRDRIFKRIGIELSKTPKELSDNIANIIVAHKSQELDVVKKESSQFLETLISFAVWHKLRNWLFNMVIGILVAFSGLVGSALLYQQNRTLEEQTDWFKTQTAHTDNQSLEATRSALFAQALEIQNILVDKPQYYDYFYANKEIGKNIHKEDLARLNIICEMFCDMIDHASSSALTGESKEGWKDFAIDMLDTSPVFRNFLLERRTWFPSIENWVDLDKYK